MVERIHRTLKAALCARGGAAARKDHLPWVLLGMRAAPREETGVSAAEAALQQQLVVPGQLPPPSERPDGVEESPAPPAVIPPTGRSYAQAATSSPLDGAEWVYVARGGAAKPMEGPPTRGRPRTASTSLVASPASAKRPGGPV